ncbi:MAG: hypothetical protein NW226_12140 [Microscillaceae bacterium]|nr:hypothetical protein [Microscillaceae bacterium]
MEDLIKLVASLKAKEIQLIKNYFYHKHGHLNKKLQLFELLCSGMVKSDLEAAKIIYKKKPDSGFCQLKKRLKEEILNFLVFQYLESHQAEIPQESEFYYQKLHWQAKVLMDRNLDEEALKLQRTADCLNENCTFLNTQFSTHDALLNSIFLHEDVTLNWFSPEKRAKYLHVQDTLAQAKMFSFHLMVQNYHHVCDKYHKVDEADLSNLEEQTQRWATPALDYWYLLSMANFYYSRQDYHNAWEQGQAACKLIRQHSELRGNQYLGFLQLHFGLLCFVQNHLKESAKYTQEAILLFNQEIGYRHKAQELQYLIFLKMNLLAQAKQALMRNFELLKKENPIRFYYLEALLAFKENNFKQSIRILNQANLPQKKKPEYCLGYKLLEIINNIELKYFDTVEYKVESFRKLILKYKDSSTDRYENIFKLLKSLCHCAFNFKHPSLKNCAEMTNLQKAELNFLWNPFHYEFIRFDEWLLSKN